MTLRKPRVLWACVVVAVAGFVLVPTAASTIPNTYVSPLFGLATAIDDDLLVADAGQGILKVDADTGTGFLYAPLLDATDVTPAARGTLYALTSGPTNGAKIFRIDQQGNASELADLFAFEEENNPHPTAVESNPFDVAETGRGAALVADAAGNTALEVGKDGRIKLVAVFTDELVSTENAKKIFGCPAGPPDVCNLPPMIDAEPVPASNAIGPNGDYYVGELKGFPAPIGESRVWRIAKNSRNVTCPSRNCTAVLDGFTSILDLEFGPDGRLYISQIDDASWLAMEFGVGVGGSVHACDLTTGDCEVIVSGIPMLTAITFRKDGSLWGTVNALIPGLADVVQLAP
jgi:hypothetical protein